MNLKPAAVAVRPVRPVPRPVAVRYSQATNHIKIMDFGRLHYQYYKPLTQ